MVKVIFQPLTPVWEVLQPDDSLNGDSLLIAAPNTAKDRPNEFEVLRSHAPIPACEVTLRVDILTISCASN